MDLNEKATVRFETMPGKQGQMGRGFFEDHLAYEDGKWKKLHCFLMIPGYSRMRYIEFVTDMSANTPIQCHQNAFRHFGGYPEEILCGNMKQSVIKRLLKQEDSTLNRQSEDFAGFYGFKPILCRPYRGQAKGKAERAAQFVRDNSMAGIKYESLPGLNGQAQAWCNKINGKVHATANEAPFERLKAERLNPLRRECIMDKINLRRVQKDCLISCAGNQYSVPAECIGKDVAAAALESVLAAYYEGKQIALHRISYQKKDMVANPQRCRRLTLKQTTDAGNILLEQGKAIDFPLKSSDLSGYDEALHEWTDHGQAAGKPGKPQIDKRQVDELAAMRFLGNGENVVFLGPPGVGKTHLASALGPVAAKHRFSTYCVNCHRLIGQLKKARLENRLPDRLKILSKYRMLIIDEIGYPPMGIQGASLFFRLIARRYEKTSTAFASNRTFSQWNEAFADVAIASAILDRVLHHCAVANVKGESCRLKERKGFMRQKQQVVNTLFEQGNA